MGADAAWRGMGFVLRVRWSLFGLFRERLERHVMETALVSCRSAHENHEGGEYDIMIHDAAKAELWSFRAVRFYSLWVFSRSNLRKSRSGFSLNAPQSSLSPW